MKQLLTKQLLIGVLIVVLVTLVVHTTRELFQNISNLKPIIHKESAPDPTISSKQIEQLVKKEKERLNRKKDSLAAESLSEESLAAENLAAESLAAENLAAESLAAESLAVQSLAAESLAAQSLAAESETSD